MARHPPSEFSPGAATMARQLESGRRGGARLNAADETVGVPSWRNVVCGVATVPRRRTVGRLAFGWSCAVVHWGVWRNRGPARPAIECNKCHKIILLSCSDFPGMVRGVRWRAVGQPGAQTTAAPKGRGARRRVIPPSPPSSEDRSVVVRAGPLATTDCESRQARKGATVTVDSGAGVRLVRTASIRRTPPLRPVVPTSAGCRGRQSAPRVAHPGVGHGRDFAAWPFPI
jgi:hypothetical protein